MQSFGRNQESDELKARRKLAFGVDVERKSGPKRAGRSDSSRSAFPTRFQKPAFSFDRDVEKKPEKRSTRIAPTTFDQ
jgi:hypothetical protein